MGQEGMQNGHGKQEGYTEHMIMNGHERQKEQSRRMIEEALFALMKEKSYEQITVAEITRRADVARRTFYRLYKNREDVLDTFWQKLCREYKEQYSALDCYDIQRIAEEYFSFWYQYRESLLLMHECGLDSMLYYSLNRFALEIVEGRMGKEAVQENIGGSTEGEELAGTEYFAAYSAGGFCSLLFRWVDGGMKEPPREYAAAVGISIRNFIKTAL